MCTNNLDKLSIIKSWLKEEGLETKEIPDSNARFNLSVTAGNKIIHVVENTDKPNRILFVSNISPPNHMQQALDKLPQDRKAALIWFIRFGILNMKVESSPIVLPLNLRIIGAVYYDGLNKNIFMEKFLDVFRSLILMEMAINRELESSSGNTGQIPDLPFYG